VLESELATSHQQSTCFHTDLKSEAAHVMAQLMATRQQLDRVEKAQKALAQQQQTRIQELECAVSASQQEASSKHSRLEGDITDLKALVKAEVSKSRQAEEQHKAEQADLAHQLDAASSLTHQLESSQAELLSQASVSARSRQELAEQASQLQAALTAANAAPEAKAAAAAQAHQQQLDALFADRKATEDSVKALQAQLSRHHHQAQEAQARAEHEALMLQGRLAEAQGSSESAREGSRLLQLQLTESLGVAKSAEQDVKRFEQQLAGAQATAVHKIQELATQAQEAQARAEQQVCKLQDHAKSAQQDVSRLEQQLAGSQAVAAKKEEELATQVEVSQKLALHAQQDSLCGQLHTGRTILDLKDDLSKSQADQSSLQNKLQQALAECKSLHGELGDAQLEHNCTKCQLESAVVERNSAQGQVDMFKSKNSPQGPPVHYTEPRSSAKKRYSAQQQRQRPHADPLQELPPGFTNLSSTTHHAHATKVNRAAAVTGQEDSRGGTAHAQEQQYPSKRPSHNYHGRVTHICASRVMLLFKSQTAGTSMACLQ
ncbi:hypothetical protein WJX82_010212, partial [Trebouxia sp. C0006]